MKDYLTYVLLLSAGFATLTGCAPNNKARVNIVYDQVANFHVYYLSPDSTVSHGAGDGMFIQYKIKQISNTGPEAKTFVFNKHKIVAVAPDKTSNEEPAGDNILLAGMLANNITVQPGQTINNVGCIIKHVLTANPKSLANMSALVGLVHQMDKSQPVSMKRAQDDIDTALVKDALPSSLQNLCGN